MAKKEVIEVKAKEGCFLQTLNIGCITIVVIVGIFIVLGLIGAAL